MGAIAGWVGARRRSDLAAHGAYLGTTVEALGERSRADRLAALVDLRALFERTGEIDLYDDRLVLTEWSERGHLVLRPGDVRAVRRAFLHGYGRVVGWLLEPGKPLILETGVAGSLVLLVHDRELATLNHGRGWQLMLQRWLSADGQHASLGAGHPATKALR